MGPEIFQRHSVLGASAASVWGVAGDFAGIASWYPGVVSVSTSRPGGNNIEPVRIITSSDGTTFEEVQLNRNESKRELVYWLRKGDLNLNTYVAHIQVREITTSSCMFIWTVLFTPGSDAVASLEDVRDVVDAGIAALARRFGSGTS